MEKAISSHRWYIANNNRHEVPAIHLIHLSHNFNGFKNIEDAIEVLEGNMDMMTKTFKEDEVQADRELIGAYIESGEFLKAKSANEKRRSIDKDQWVVRLQSGSIEGGLCNYKAAIAHFREVIAELRKKEYDDSSMGKIRVHCSVLLARTLLRYSADNGPEAFAIFQEELDRCVNPLIRE